jgi:hypothetical protein
MVPRLTLALLLAISIPGCVTYEYEHEFWLRVNGSGTVYITGRPSLWASFKGVGYGADLEASGVEDDIRAVFERSGLRVNKITRTQRGGQAYLFISADFEDINRLSESPAFPDLSIKLNKAGPNLVLNGTWRRPASFPIPPLADQEGLMAVRFHLPSKVYTHRNAFGGVERGNIVAWRQDVTSALRDGRLEVGATMDERSILLSTIKLFATAILLAAIILTAAIYFTFRRGARRLAVPPKTLSAEPPSD